MKKTLLVSILIFAFLSSFANEVKPSKNFVKKESSVKKSLKNNQAVEIIFDSNEVCYTRTCTTTTYPDGTEIKRCTPWVEITCPPITNLKPVLAE